MSEKGMSIGKMVISAAITCTQTLFGGVNFFDPQAANPEPPNHDTLLQETCPEPETCCEPECVDLCDTTPECPPALCAYNAPVLTNSCAYTGLYATGSFLYWRASGDYLAEAFVNNSVSADPTSISNALFLGNTINPKFKYKPGFKVGLGYAFQRDGWDLYAEYTRFHQTVDNSTTVSDSSAQQLIPLWLTFVNQSFTGPFSSASSKWTTNLDILDVEIGRDYFCGRYLTFRPSLGLRVLWLKQTYNLDYTAITAANVVSSFNKSNSWAIGPRLALCNAWNIYKDLKILGDLGISLLNVQDHIKAKQTTPLLIAGGTPLFVSGNISYQNKSSISLIKPILDLSLGLGWGGSVYHDKVSFELALTYDYSVYWDQGSIQLGHAPLVFPGAPPQVIVGSTALSNGTLSIQGLTVTARLDF